jgi:hypothetical protein
MKAVGAVGNRGLCGFPGSGGRGLCVHGSGSVHSPDFSGSAFRGAGAVIADRAFALRVG